MDSFTSEDPETGALIVEYCPQSGLPYEYLEFSSMYKEAREALEKKHPELCEEISADINSMSLSEGGDDSGKKRQKRGGKGLKKKAAAKSAGGEVIIQKAVRNKRKFVTCPLHIFLSGTVLVRS